MHVNKMIYRYAHKLHHLSYATVGLSAHYMSVIDFAFESVIPVVILMVLVIPIPPLSPYFYGFSHSGFVGFTAVGSFVSVMCHSGWKVSFCPSPWPHFIHHHKQIFNYGSFVTDKIANTELLDLPEKEKAKLSSPILDRKKM